MFIDAEGLLSGTFSAGAFTGQDLSTSSTGPNWATNYYALTPLAPLFASGGTVPGGVGGTNSGRDVGGGYPDTYLYILITTSFAASGGASTTDFRVYTDSATPATGTSAANGTAVLMQSTGAIAKASNTAGTAYKLRLVRGTKAVPWKKYIAVDYEIATNAVTTGKVVAFITNNVQDDYLYAKGFSIS